MLDVRYTSERTWGFFVDDVRPHSLTGRFVEKELVVQTTEDPFGNSQRFDRTVFNITRFQVDLKRHWVEIHDAPRSLTPFFSQLAEQSGFLASVEPIYIQPLSWFHSFRKLVPDAMMTKAAIDDFEVAESVMARAMLFGEVDVERYIQTVAGKRRVTASAIQITFSIEADLYRLNVSAAGKIKFLGAAQPDGLELVRNAIPSGSNFNVRQ
ncbi:MAG: hypothetical protein DMF06_05555 [Verrucomicrobia bacterium]|nr:MAG: hypothetical protein DMF06_05555 [Verrucomicrobiota bacterium]